MSMLIFKKVEMTNIRDGIMEVAKYQVERGKYKSQSETVTDSVRQLVYRYGANAGSLEEVRVITKRASKKSGERLSQAVIKIREESVRYD
jgi:Arc/MetJ-type ribon-helix-helix transcriptional regulator